MGSGGCDWVINEIIMGKKAEVKSELIYGQNTLFLLYNIINVTHLLHAVFCVGDMQDFVDRFI